MLFLLKFTLLFFVLIVASNAFGGQVKRDTLHPAHKNDTVIAIDEVEISAYQIRSGMRIVPGNISLLSGEGLSISEGTSFATALNMLPGITMQSGTYATNRIVIRGMGSRTPYNTNRIKAYLNDIPITSSDGISTPEDIDMLSLGRIEVVKGPASTLYGSGLGGSINLYTPAITSNSLNIQSNFASFNTTKAFLGGSMLFSNGGVAASFSHTRTDGYRDNGDFNKSTLLLSAPWQLGNWSITYTALVIDAKAGIPSSLSLSQFNSNPSQAAPNWEAIEGYKDYIRGLSGVSISKNFSESISNSITLFARMADNFERRPFNNLDDISVGGGLRNKFLYKKNSVELAVGAEYIIDSYSWEIELNDVVLNSNREIRNHLNTFVLANYRINPKWLLTSGFAVNSIRYELYDLFIQEDDKASRQFPTIVSPRAGFSYSPNNLMAIFGSVGHGFSMPSPEETLLPEGNVNPDIKPEEGIQFEIGTRYTSVSKRVELDAAFYWIELKNLLVTKRFTEDIFTGINAGRTRHNGIELRIRYTLFDLAEFPGKISTRVSYFKSINRFIDFTDDGLDRSGNLLPGIPSYTAQLHINWEPINTLTINVHLQQQGSQHLNDENSLQYSGFFLGDLKMLAPINISDWRIIAYFGVNNFTNTHYASMVLPNAIGFGGVEPRYYYPGLPRHYYAGLRFNISR